MAIYTLLPARKAFTHFKAPSAYDSNYTDKEGLNIEQGVYPPISGVSIPLVDDSPITLTRTSVQPFDFCVVEVVQDAAGGHVPTWTNATGTGGVVAVPNSTPATPTLYVGVFLHDTWVLSLFAQDYASASVMSAIARGFARMADAMLPLPSTQTVVDGYVAAFS